MKKLVLTLLIGLSSMSLQARENLLERRFEQQGYGGPEIILTQMKDQQTLMVGGKILGLWGNDLHGFTTGLAGYATPGRLILNPTHDFNVAYGGVTAGYHRQPANLVHFTSDLLVGFGNVWVTETGATRNTENAIAMVMEITLGAGINLTDHMQIGISTGWRMMSNPDIQGLNGQDISGVTMRLSFEFGSFN